MNQKKRREREFRPDWMTEQTPEDCLPANFAPDTWDEGMVFTPEMIEFLENGLAERERLGSIWFNQAQGITLAECRNMINAYKQDYQIKTT